VRRVFNILNGRVVRRLFTCSIILFLVSGCSGKGEDRGSILISSIRSDGKVAETKIYVYPQHDHTKEITFGYSGLDIYVPVGTYDLKIDWRGTTKWLNNVRIEKYSKFKKQVIFPLGKLLVKSTNTDGSPADASVTVTPVSGDQGIEVQTNDKGEIVTMNVLGGVIKLGDKEEDVISKFKPEFKRSEPTEEGEGEGESTVTHHYRVLGTNIDLAFTKSGTSPGTLKKIIYDEKIAAGVAGEGIELNPGRYDVKVEHERITKWIRGVEIKDKENTEEAVSFPVGKIIINSESPISEGKVAHVGVYLEGRYEIMEKGGKLGEEIKIVPGMYDILVTVDSKKYWLRGVEVKDKGVVSKKINL